MRASRRADDFSTGVCEAPKQAQQPIDLAARRRGIHDVAPRGRTIERTDQLARFSVRDLVGALLIALLAPRSLTQVAGCGCGNG
jgi:hypothetical protein